MFAFFHPYIASVLCTLFSMYIINGMYMYMYIIINVHVQLVVCGFRHCGSVAMVAICTYVLPLQSEDPACQIWHGSQQRPVESLDT